MAEALTVLEALLLGLVQGLTEWLPISSSAHLVIAEALFDAEAPIVFEVVVHLGTLLVVLVFYRRVIAQMLRAVGAAPRAFARTRSWRRVVWDDPDRRLAWLVVVATLPTAIVGFAFRDVIESLFDHVAWVGGELVVTGFIIWSTLHARLPRAGGLGWREAFVIGTAQGVSIFPGISRSGATIAAGMHAGVEREEAARFSFLISIPAIMGAAVLQFEPDRLADVAAAPVAYLVGFLAALVAGYATLVALVVIIRKRVFHYFAPYCWVVGGAVLVAGLMGWL